MLEINTVSEFMAIPIYYQEEIQKALRTKDRLDNWLRSQNKRVGQARPEEKPEWKPCKRCEGHPGWVWHEGGRDDSDIHPSQINKCLKFLHYSCTGQTGQMEEFHDGRLQMIFDMGSAWHLVLQNYGKRGAWGDPAYYRPEVPIDPDAKLPDGSPVLPLAEAMWIRGSVDAVIDRYEIENVQGIGPVAIRLVHEYKTISTAQYTKLTKPKPEHKYQATIYAAVFNIPIVVYVYTNKDDCKTADFPVPFDYTIWNEVSNKIQTVQQYVNSDILPPWELTSAVKNPAECMECGFRKLCQPPLSQLGKKSL